MEKARGAMSQGMRRLDRALKQSRSWRQLHLVLFAVAAVVLLLFFSRVVGWVRFVLCLPSLVFGYCK